MNTIETKVEEMLIKHAELLGTVKNSIEAIDELKISVEKLEHRLFVDNGSVSIQTRLDRHERFIKVCTWLSGVCMTAVMGVIVVNILQ